MLKGRTRQNISQLGLYHGPQIAGCVMAKFHDLAGLTLEHNNHPSTNLSCVNSHNESVKLRPAKFNV